MLTQVHRSMLIDASMRLDLIVIDERVSGPMTDTGPGEGRRKLLDLAGRAPGGGRERQVPIGFFNLSLEVLSGPNRRKPKG